MRIATSFIHQLAASDIHRAQIELFDAQRQAGSEKKAHDLKGYARDAKAVVFARGFVAKADAYAAAGVEIINRLGAQDIALGSAAKAAQSTRLGLTNALGLDSGLELMSQVRTSFAQALSGMNMSHAGRYLFGGVRDDAPPVNITSIEELGPLVDAGAIFDNAPVTTKAQLDKNTSVAIAPLASDVSRALFDSFKRIYDYDVSIGGFGQNLTAADRTFLETEIGQLATITEGLNASQSKNGGVQQRVETIVERQGQERDYFAALVSDLEGVDLAEVASRLSQAQLQMQASVQVYAVVRDSSLLNLLSR